MITGYQSGDRVEMRVDEYAQYGAKFPAELRDAMTYIVDSPEAISAYNESGNSPAISQDAGFGAGGQPPAHMMKPSSISGPGSDVFTLRKYWSRT